MHGLVCMYWFGLVSKSTSPMLQPGILQIVAVNIEPMRNPTIPTRR